MENVELKFNHELVPRILSGEISSVWRMFDDADIEEGDYIYLVDKMTDEDFARADVSLIYEKHFGDISSDDLVGHEKYFNHHVMLEKFQSRYGDRVNDETMVKIIRFRLIKQ